MKSYLAVCGNRGAGQFEQRFSASSASTALSVAQRITRYAKRLSGVGFLYHSHGEHKHVLYHNADLSAVAIGHHDNNDIPGCCCSCRYDHQLSSRFNAGRRSVLLDSRRPSGFSYGDRQCHCDDQRPSADSARRTFARDARNGYRASDCCRNEPYIEQPVLFDGTAVNTTYEKPNLQFNVPNSAFTIAQVHTVQVSDPAYGKSNVATYEVYAPQPGPTLFVGQPTQYMSEQLITNSLVPDLNGDGRADLVMVVLDSTSPLLYVPVVRYGQGDERFQRRPR